MQIYLKFNANTQPLKLECANDAIPDADCLHKHLEQTYNLDHFILCKSNGLKLNSNEKLIHGFTYNVYPTVLGGKGGFGSLLRAFGKQITMSTNKEACRDLTGRRIRNVNRDKNLKKLLENQEALAQQKEQKKKEKREKRRKLLENKHTFADEKYEEQKQKISTDLEQVLNVALNDKTKRKLQSTDDIKSTTNDEINLNPNDKAITKSTDKQITEKPEQNKGTKESVKKQDTLNKMKGWLGAEIDTSSEEDDEPKDKRQKVN